MAEIDRTAWSKEVQRIEKRIKHRQEAREKINDEIKTLDADLRHLLKKISDDYEKEHGE